MCPHCGATLNWKLGDRRLRCQKCRRRYRERRTAWSLVRLKPEVKRRLVRAFCDGQTASSQVEALGVSRPTVERFYRVLRACCAHDLKLVPSTTDLQPVRLIQPVGGLRIDKRSGKKFDSILVLRLVRQGLPLKQVRFEHSTRKERQTAKTIFPSQSLDNPMAGKAKDDIHILGPGQSLVYLLLDRNRIITSEQQWNSRWIDQERRTTKGTWNLAKSRLCRYKSIPRAQISLYLAETAWVITNMGKGMADVLMRLVKSTSEDDLRVFPRELHLFRTTAE